jgi:hypothetical protein
LRSLILASTEICSALLRTQLIRFLIAFLRVQLKNALDTLVADQIRSEEAFEKLVHARDLWTQAAAAAASEG